MLTAASAPMPNEKNSPVYCNNIPKYILLFDCLNIFPILGAPYPCIIAKNATEGQLQGFDPKSLMDIPW